MHESAGRRDHWHNAAPLIQLLRDRIVHVHLLVVEDGREMTCFWIPRIDPTLDRKLRPDCVVAISGPFLMGVVDSDTVRIG